MKSHSFEIGKKGLYLKTAIRKKIKYIKKITSQPWHLLMTDRGRRGVIKLVRMKACKSNGPQNQTPS